MSRSEVISKNNASTTPLASTFDASEAKSSSSNAAASKSRNVSECEKIEDFEYKGYYKFGRILGKGSFGTVVECVRKCDERPMALKFFQYNAIHKWYAESTVSEYMDRELLSNSDFFNHQPSSSSNKCDLDADSDQESTTNEDRLLPSEVACLLRVHKIPGVVRILDYIPADEVTSGSSSSDSVSSGSESGGSSGAVGGAGDGVKNDDALIGIVMERDVQEECLFDYLVRRNTVSEREARTIMSQLVTVSLELLQHGVFHGDLKSENILINPSTMRIKIIDFGSAQILSDPSTPPSGSGSSSSRHHNHHHHHHHGGNGGATSSHGSGGGGHHKCNSQSMVGKLVRTFRGTNLYKPPEFILHRCFYPRPSTVWTFGIILYDLVCGRFPFDKDADVLTHQDKEIDFGQHASQLSDGLKDLIRRCLAFYVADRIVIEKVISHPWMNATNA